MMASSLYPNRPSSSRMRLGFPTDSDPKRPTKTVRFAPSPPRDDSSSNDGSALPPIPSPPTPPPPPPPPPKASTSAAAAPAPAPAASETGEPTPRAEYFNALNFQNQKPPQQPPPPPLHNRRKRDVTPPKEEEPEADGMLARLKQRLKKLYDGLVSGTSTRSRYVYMGFALLLTASLAALVLFYQTGLAAAAKLGVVVVVAAFTALTYKHYAQLSSGTAESVAAAAKAVL